MRWSRSTSTARASASGGSCASSSERNLPLTVFGVAMALERYPELVAAFMRAAATRSPATAGAGSTTRTCRRGDRARATCDIAHAACIERADRRRRPLGWYTGRDSPNTRRLVVEHGGFEYDSDYYGDDLPFWCRGREERRHHGCRTWSCPYTLDTNDMRFVQAAGLQHRRALLRLPARRLRRALRRRRPGRPRPAEDDVDRHALPRCSASPAGSARCAASSTTCRRTSTSGSRAASTSPATGAPCTRLPRSAPRRWRESCVILRPSAALPEERP